MHTGKLLLEIQVMPVRTTDKYIIASFKPQLATAGKPAVTSLLSQKQTPPVGTEVPESLK